MVLIRIRTLFQFLLLHNSNCTFCLLPRKAAASAARKFASHTGAAAAAAVLALVACTPLCLAHCQQRQQQQHASSDCKLSYGSDSWQNQTNYHSPCTVILVMPHQEGVKQQQYALLCLLARQNALFTH
jgi:hypothetical protein